MNQEYYIVWQDWGHGMLVVSVCDFDLIESMIQSAWQQFKDDYPDYLFEETIGTMTKTDEYPDEYFLQIYWKRDGRWSVSGINDYRIKKIQTNTLIDGVYASD